MKAYIENCPLHRNTPHIIHNISHTQFSIARYYGGIGFNGQNYTYFSKDDTLVRDDVLKWQKKEMENKK